MRHRFGVLTLVLGSLWAMAVSAQQPLHHITSDTCQLCHKEVFKQWQGSMHAQSTALKDPIHATFYGIVAGSPNEEGVTMKASGKYPLCLNCHAPNAAMDKKTKLDANPAYAEGVNCIACHTLQSYNGIKKPDGKLQLGIHAYDISTSQLQGPGVHSNRGLERLIAAADPFGGSGLGDSAKPNPHLGEPVEMDGVQVPALPMMANPTQLKSNDACMGCHDMRPNANGVPLCQTGDEYIASGSQVDCIACHMPINNGVADHSMGGGHDSAMLRRSVLFTVEGKREGDTIATTVTLTNQQPHNLPTGAPFRNIHLKLTAYDDQGSVVWQNAEGHPAKSDPKAYLLYSLVDDEGKPASPTVATKVGSDNRLKPFEERKLNYTIPAAGVALVRGELYYSLLWPGLVKKFTHLDKELTDPKLIASSELQL
ncbi:cytochrome c family protein [Ectothiorhodospiraceae bacterium BW-2]|nr:cytochrome c family protein [Ectothiorhodospiraceae bacterium BW-2]